jgi:dolichol-phosphate mannosyltransferase
MPADPAVSILVPVFNEQESLPDFLRRLSGVLRRWKRNVEVIFVDDASMDDSAAILNRFCSEVPGARLIRHAVNRGRGNAILTAAGRARGNIVVTIDADLENPPEAIPLLVGGIRRGVSCATGFRANRSRRDLRGAASWVYNITLAALTGQPLRDCNCGLKAIRRETLRLPAIRSWLEKDGDYFRFLVFLMDRVGLRTVEHAIPYEPRCHGRSRYGWKRYFKAGLDFVRLLVSDVRGPYLR